MTPDPNVDRPQPVDDESVPEWKQRLLRQLAERQARRDRVAADRAQFAERRQHGLAARQRQKLARSANQIPEEGQMIIPVSKKALDGAPGTGDRNRDHRVITCRYLRRGAEGQCTAEAVDPDADVLICMRHAARVLELINTRAGTTRHTFEDGQP